MILEFFFMIFFPAIHCVDFKHKTTDEIIEYYGYESEIHAVETEDGFTLHIFRLGGNEGATPVYLQHGFLDSSDSWFALGPRLSMGFLLAEAGFDVWAGNFRGNVYASHHKTLKPEQEEYWDFSYNTLGCRDVRDMINKILEVTGKQKLVHIGHSMGTSSFYVAASEFPEINGKVMAHLSLAPITSFAYTRSPIFSARFLEPFITMLMFYDRTHRAPLYRSTSMMEVPRQSQATFKTVLQRLHNYKSPSRHTPSLLEIARNIRKIQSVVLDDFGVEFLILAFRILLSTGEINGEALRNYCTAKPENYRICLRCLNVVVGEHEDNYTEDIVHIMFNGTPKSSPLQEALHFSQQSKAGHIFYYNYRDADENMEKYNQSTPPEVIFEDISVPIYFLYGPNDLFTDVQDVEASYYRLGKPAGLYPIKDSKFNHMDFLFGKNMPEVLNPLVLEILNKYKE